MAHWFFQVGNGRRMSIFTNIIPNLAHSTIQKIIGIGADLHLLNEGIWVYLGFTPNHLQKQHIRFVVDFFSGNSTGGNEFGKAIELSVKRTFEQIGHQSR